MFTLARSFKTAAAAAVVAASFGAPALAQGEAAFYVAQLEAPAAKSVNVAGGVVWKCEGTSCTGTKGTSRPVRVCRELNRELGTVTAFSAKGEALEDELLARCNG